MSNPHQALEPWKYQAISLVVDRAVWLPHSMNTLGGGCPTFHRDLGSVTFSCKGFNRSFLSTQQMADVQCFAVSSQSNIEFLLLERPACRNKSYESDQGFSPKEEGRLPIFGDAVGFALASEVHFCSPSTEIHKGKQKSRDGRWHGLRHSRCLVLFFWR